MKAPREGKDRWENTLTRYFAAHNIPLVFKYRVRRFVGIAGHTFARLNPKTAVDVWAKMPHYMRKYEQLDVNKEVVILVTNRGYGDSVDDSLVVMRVRAFTPMLKALIENDKERWIHATHSDR